jgi:hypothetical protein
MAIYDFEGMFGDRFSTEQAINDAMFEEVISFGQLDRTKYAPMTASTYYQAAGGGTPLGSMLKQAHPMMKRQNLLDKIKKKYPDPRTPKELYDLAKELSINGFGDLSMQIRQVAMEMEKNEATKAYQTTQVNKPTEGWLKKIPETLKGSIMTTALENEYLRVSGKADLINYDKNEYDSVGVWRDFRKAQLEDIDNLIQQFADFLHIPGITKQDIQAAIGDDAALTEKFIAWIGTSGNRDVANNLLIAMGRLDTEASVANNLPHTQEKVDVSKKDFPMTYKMNEKSAENMKIYLEGLIQKGSNLKPHQLKQLEELKRRFPMGDIGLANIPPTVDAWWGYG